MPYRPMCSSSAARWNVKRARQVDPRRDGSRRPRRALRRPAPSCRRNPGRSSLPSSTTPSHGPCRQFARSPTGTTSRWPFQASVGRSPEPIDATTLGRPSSPRIVSGDAPIPVRMSVATSAAWSSVPPGFSLGRGDQRARERQDLVGVDRRRRPPPRCPSSTMATDGTRDPVANGARARSLEQDPHRPRPAHGDRLAAVLAPFVEAPEPSLVFTVRSSDDVAARRRDLVPRRVAGSRRDARPDGAPGGVRGDRAGRGGDGAGRRASRRSTPP